MKTSKFDYHLPQKLIAQNPIEPRDHSRLMVLNRKKQSITHDYFYNLPQYLTKNDVLVFNESKVIPARLYGKKETGGKVELLLLKKLEPDTWECMSKPGIKVGTVIFFENKLTGKVIDKFSTGLRIIKFNMQDKEFEKSINQIGHTPTPPYIETQISHKKEYQTIYAKNKGSVAAPTAGFHFTEKLFENFNKKGIQKEFLTLHIGLGTFQPVKEDVVEDHFMHSEWFSISRSLASKLNAYKKEGRNIISVGTTSTRALEAASIRSDSSYVLEPFTGETSLFITPGYTFKFVDKMITNFHLPKSTLLMLIASFAGKEFVLEAYRQAIEKEYRFYSFGDGMLII